MGRTTHAVPLSLTSIACRLFRLVPTRLDLCCSQGLANLRKQLVKLVSQGIDGALADLRLSYSVLWDEPDARSRHVRERLIKTLEVAHVEGRNADLALRAALGEALPRLAIDDPDGEIEELEAAPKAEAETIDLLGSEDDDGEEANAAVGDGAPLALPPAARPIAGEGAPPWPPAARLIAVKAERM